MTSATGTAAFRHDRGRRRLAAIASPTERPLRLVEWGLFLALPIERVLTFDLAGFTVRPVYFFMAAFIGLGFRDIVSGLPAMPTAALVVVAVGVSQLASYDRVPSFSYGLWAVFVIAFALVAVGYLREGGERIDRWVRMYVVSAGGWALFAIGQWFASFASPQLAYSWLGSVPRLNALAYEPSFLAFYLVPPLVLSLATSQLSWGLAIAAALAMSTSRSGALGFVVAAGLLLAIGRRPIRLNVGKALAVAGVTLGLVFVVSLLELRLPDATGGSRPAPVSETEGRVQQAPLPTAEGRDGADNPSDVGKFATLEDEASARPRLESWKDAWAVFRLEPLTGVGVGAFGAAAQENGIGVGAPKDTVKTTNLWLEVMAEMGILGLVALALWGLAPLPALWKLRSRLPLATALIGALLASLFMFAFVQTWWVPYRWIPWILAYALVGSTVSGWLRSRLRRQRPH